MKKCPICPSWRGRARPHGSELRAASYLARLHLDLVQEVVHGARPTPLSKRSYSLRSRHSQPCTLAVRIGPRWHGYCLALRAARVATLSAAASPHGVMPRRA
eukprot:scaffold4501_cov395-Prasinococcus_capsulatus_cf.AAC.16